MALSFLPQSEAELFEHLAYLESTLDSKIELCFKSEEQLAQARISGSVDQRIPMAQYCYMSVVEKLLDRRDLLAAQALKREQRTGTDAVKAGSPQTPLVTKAGPFQTKDGKDWLRANLPALQLEEQQETKHPSCGGDRTVSQERTRPATVAQINVRLPQPPAPHADASSTTQADLPLPPVVTSLVTAPPKFAIPSFPARPAAPTAQKDEADSMRSPKAGPSQKTVKPFPKTWAGNAGRTLIDNTNSPLVRSLPPKIWSRKEGDGVDRFPLVPVDSLVGLNRYAVDKTVKWPTRRPWDPKTNSPIFKEPELQAYIHYDPTGKPYLSPEHLAMTYDPRLEQDQHQLKQYLEDHAIFIVCKFCTIYKRRCAHAFPCKNASDANEKTEYVFAGSPAALNNDFCRYGMRCYNFHHFARKAFGFMSEFTPRYNDLLLEIPDGEYTKACIMPVRSSRTKPARPAVHSSRAQQRFVPYPRYQLTPLIKPEFANEL